MNLLLGYKFARCWGNMKTWRRKREGRNCINVYEMLKKIN